jgi:hypothetical protein
MEKKKTVVVYESFYEAIQLLSSQEAQMELFNGMMKYGLYGEEPEFNTQELKLTWALYRPNMDANIARYNKAVESGRKSAGNRNPKKEVASSSTSVHAKKTNESTTVDNSNLTNEEKLIKFVKLKKFNEDEENSLIRQIQSGYITSIIDLESIISGWYIPEPENEDNAELTM